MATNIFAEDDFISEIDGIISAIISAQSNGVIPLAEPSAAPPIAGQPIAEQPIAAPPIAGQPIAEQPIAEQPIAAPPLMPPAYLASTPMAAAPIFTKGRNPKMVIFDCDWTLYGYDCDKDRLAPFHRDPHTRIVYDRFYRVSNPFKDVPSIVGAFVDAGIQVAFASRNSSSEQVKALLKTIPMYCNEGVRSLWDAMPNESYFQCYSSLRGGRGKTGHFTQIRLESGVSFEDMLFFDDFPDNTLPATAMGITSVLLINRRGLQWDDVQMGIEQWRAKN
jgi:HAD superfamily phosphatase (TIGR01681 family)